MEAIVEQVRQLPSWMMRWLWIRQYIEAFYSPWPGLFFWLNNINQYELPKNIVVI